MRLLVRLFKKLLGLNRLRVIKVTDIYGKVYYRVQRRFLTKDPKAKTIWEWRDEPCGYYNDATYFTNPDQAIEWFEKCKRFPKKEKIKVLDEF